MAFAAGGAYPDGSDELTVPIGYDVSGPGLDALTVVVVVGDGVTVATVVVVVGEGAGVPLVVLFGAAVVVVVGEGVVDVVVAVVPLRAGVFTVFF